MKITLSEIRRLVREATVTAERAAELGKEAWSASRAWRHKSGEARQFPERAGLARSADAARRKAVKAHENAARAFSSVGDAARAERHAEELRSLSGDH